MICRQGTALANPSRGAIHIADRNDATNSLETSTRLMNLRLRGGRSYILLRGDLVIDVAKLREAHGYDADLAGSGGNVAGPEAENAGPTRPQRGAVAGGSRGGDSSAATDGSAGSAAPAAEDAPPSRPKPHVVAAGGRRTAILPLAAGGER